LGDVFIRVPVLSRISLRELPTLAIAAGLSRILRKRGEPYHSLAKLSFISFGATFSATATPLGAANREDGGKEAEWNQHARLAATSKPGAHRLRPLCIRSMLLER